MDNAALTVSEDHGSAVPPHIQLSTEATYIKPRRGLEVTSVSVTPSEVKNFEARAR